MALSFAILLALQPAAPVQLPPGLATAYADWGICRGEYVARHHGDEGSAEAIAEASMADCIEHEERARAITERHGSGWRNAFREHRAAYRRDSVRAVEEMRNGQAPTDPVRAWGFCIGQESTGSFDGLATETAVDRMFAACRNFEHQVLAHLASSVGERRAPALLAQMRGELRAQLIRRIEAGTLFSGD